MTRQHVRTPALVRVLAAALLALPVLALFPASAEAAGPNLVTNGNFATPVATTPGGVTVTSVPGWTLEGGVAEIDPPAAFNPPAGSPAGTQSTDLNPNDPVAISQTITTTPGTSYVLSFQLAGNFGCPPMQKTGTVSIDGSQVGTLDFDTTGRSATDMGWILQTHTFTATGASTTLEFASTTTGSNCGPVITDVSVVEAPLVGTPMVSWQALAAAAVLALMLGAAFVWTRRRRGAATH